MIIVLGFILDFLITLIAPFKTYFVIHDIDKNKLVNVIIVGFILDFIYRNWFLNLFILLILFFCTKALQIKKKYYYLKNIVLFIIYFNLLFFLGHSILANYIYMFLEGFLSYLVYIFVMKKLWKF